MIPLARSALVLGGASPGGDFLFTVDTAATLILEDRGQIETREENALGRFERKCSSSYVFDVLIFDGSQCHARAAVQPEISFDNKSTRS